MSALTARELEVALLVSRGCSNREIAAELRLQTVTVKNHLARVFRKLLVSNRTQLALMMLPARD